MTRPGSPTPEAPDPGADAPAGDPSSSNDAGKTSKRPREIGGPSGLEPTRYGDWERNGRVSDF